MGWLIKLLTGGTVAGSAGPWIFGGVLLAAIVGGGVAGAKAQFYIDALEISGLKTQVASEKTNTADERARTARCVASHEKGRADGAEQANSELVKSINAALDADRQTARTANQRAAGYAAALVEANNVASQKPPMRGCIDPGPLRALFLGMRAEDAARAAAARTADDRGAASHAQHGLHPAAVHP